jgi:hypothetical protein
MGKIDDNSKGGAGDDSNKMVVQQANKAGVTLRYPCSRRTTTVCGLSR